MVEDIDLDANFSDEGGEVSGSTTVHGVVTGGVPDSMDAALQVEIGGATTNVDIYVEGRTSPDIGYENVITSTNVSNGYSDLQTGIDLSGLYDVRLRVVNQDGTNDGSVRAVLSVSG